MTDHDRLREALCEWTAIEHDESCRWVVENGPSDDFSLCTCNNGRIAIRLRDALAALDAEPERGGWVRCTGLWLRSTDDQRIEVLVEIDGQWRRAVREMVADVGGVISHIVEPLGMKTGSVALEGPRPLPAPPEGEG